MNDLSLNEVQTDSDLLDQAVDFVYQLFREKLSPDFQYHSIEYVLETVNVCENLCESHHLSTADREHLVLATLFHLTGLTSQKTDYQQASVEIFKDFANDQGIEDSRTEQVVRLIRSTVEGHQPKSLTEEILHDVLISDMGRRRFFSRAELLRLERKLVYGKEYSEEEWEEEKQHLLVENDFHTLSGKREFGSRRAKNIRQQRANIIKGKKISLREETGKDLGRGVDTLYRATYRNHINLSSIADDKANMMISINTVILSVIVTLSGAGLSFTNSFMIEHLRYVVPIFVLLLTSLASVVFAILSARPDVSSNEVDSLEELDLENSSLLYFGKFTEVSINHFKEYMNRLKLNQNQLYDAMSMDLYSLGAVLKRKYRLISISYNIFMIGLSLCVLSFIFIFIYTQSTV